MLAKCISTKCERYDNCLRSTVEPNHEVNYLAYCGEGDERWYVPIEISIEEIKEDKNGE